MTPTNPLILALDTTQDLGSIALYRGERSLECREATAPQGFGAVIFDHIQSVLAAHGASVADVDVYGVASGPGSFTGVRVGLAAGMALAKVHGKTIVPVSNLAAVADLAARLPNTPRLLIPILDARRREVYAGVYEQTDEPGRFTTLMEDSVISPPRLEERLRERGIGFDQAVYCGPDVEKFDLALLPRLVTARAVAGAVARIALAAWLAGDALLPEAVDANYVRRSDAEIFNKP